MAFQGEGVNESARAHQRISRLNRASAWPRSGMQVFAEGVDLMRLMVAQRAGLTRRVHRP
jgi:hypothetical protein